MYNSDGYVLIDLTGVDITKTNQHLTGIYNRVLTVIDINKLALVINAGDLTPMAAVVHKKLNYYVITTPLYIFTINSNDIIMIEEAGEATVDVAIVPALLDGVKIADFTIGAVEGSLYAPEQQSEINDNITTDYTTWSSYKINTELSDKAEASDVYTKTEVDTALAAKADTSDIPTKTSELLNDSGFITSAQVPTIDDSSVSSTSVWSSYKTSNELATKANAAETTAALALKANSADVYTKSEVDTALANKADKSSIDQIAKIEVVQLFNNVSIANNSEYNSNGGSIPHATIPTKAGYTPIAIINVQALGYYGSRILLYAWIDSGDGKIHFSAFNTMENFQYKPTVQGYAWVLYIKSGLL